MERWFSAITGRTAGFLDPVSPPPFSLSLSLYIYIYIYLSIYLSLSFNATFRFARFLALVDARVYFLAICRSTRKSRILRFQTAWSCWRAVRRTAMFSPAYIFLRFSLRRGLSINSRLNGPRVTPSLARVYFLLPGAGCTWR